MEYYSLPTSEVERYCGTDYLPPYLSFSSIATVHYSSSATKGSDDRPTSECKIYSECDLLSSSVSLQLQCSIPPHLLMKGLILGQ